MNYFFVATRVRAAKMSCRRLLFAGHKSDYVETRHWNNGRPLSQCAITTIKSQRLMGKNILLILFGRLVELHR